MKRIRKILSPGRWLILAARLTCGVVFIGVLGTGMTGCAGFERDWRRAVAAQAAGGPAGLHRPGVGPAGSRSAAGVSTDRTTSADGAWSGRWVSGANGHDGRLRCVVSGTEESEASFTYWASWAIFSGTFPTKQPVARQADGSLRSTGTWRLPGWAGGEYAYDVTIQGNRFSGTWKCARDHGKFEMTRAGTGRDPE